MQRRHPYPSAVSRREALLWITALAGGLGVGMCGVGGLAALLIRRHQGADPAAPATRTIAVPTLPISPPTIIPRSAWNARPVNPAAENEHGLASAENPLGWYVYQGDLAQVYTTVAVHHSYPIRRDTGTMRAIQDLHLDSSKWADIGYHFGIGADGKVYAGRDINVRGASVAGYNTGTIGVVVIGDFEQELPSDAQLASLQLLVNWLTVTYTLTHLAGHYEFNPETRCPGQNMKLYLDLLAKNAGLQRGTGGYHPATLQSRLKSGGSVCC